MVWYRNPSIRESISSSASRELNQYLNKLLRQDAQILRDLLAKGASPEELQHKKKNLLQEIFNFLAVNLGLPPRSFDFAYRDKDNVYHRDRNVTPQAFYKKYVGLKNYLTMSPLSMLLQLTNLTINLIQSNLSGTSLCAPAYPLSQCRNEPFQRIGYCPTQSWWFPFGLVPMSVKSNNRQTGIMATNTYDFTSGLWVSNSIKTRLED